MGGAIAALLGVKPSVAADRWLHEEGYSNVLPYTYEKNVVRAIICKRMPDGSLKARVIQGGLSGDFMRNVDMCREDGVGEVTEVSFNPIPDIFFSDETATADSGYVGLPANADYIDIT